MLSAILKEYVGEEEVKVEEEAMKIEEIVNGGFKPDFETDAHVYLNEI